MKMQLFRRITIRGTDRAGIAGETSGGHAAHLPRPRLQVRPARRHLKSGWQDGLCRTAGETRPAGTVVAGVLMTWARRGRQRLRKTQRAAISVPEAILRMNKNAEW